ncbi:MAG: hypothetical protein ACRD1P_09895 [Thermoanaerobaculia bacterium]
MRPPTRGCGRLAAVAVVALAACSATAAATDAFVSPATGGRLAPGSSLVVAWTLDSSTVQGMDEMELILSLDDGASFPVRVTGRIEPEARSALWRVPALPSEHARIALRSGRGEQAGTERLLLISEPFTIASSRTLFLEELYTVGDEWRTREALEGAPVRTPPRDLGSADCRENLRLHVVDAATLQTGPAVTTVANRQSTSPRPSQPSRGRIVARIAACLRPAAPLRL